VQIIPADLDDPHIQALLMHHRATARAAVAICSAHALDIDALRAADIAVFAGWERNVLLVIGALRALAGGNGEIKSMHTALAARGRGAGAAMGAHLIAAARAHGMQRVSLETGSTDFFAPARRLYRRLGFTECAAFGGYAADDNSVFMTLAL